MSVSINYKNNEILSIPSSGDYKLNTKGKYLEDDIRITATGGSIWQDANGYIHLSDEGTPGSNNDILYVYSDLNGESPISTNGYAYVSCDFAPIGDGKFRYWIDVDASDLTFKVPVTVPTYSSYRYTGAVDWGDGSEITEYSYGNTDHTHTYSSPGRYCVSIWRTGGAEVFSVNAPSSTNDKKKVVAFELFFIDYPENNISGLSNVRKLRYSSQQTNISFSACTNLEDVILPSSTTSIGTCANCKALEYLTIPASVTSITNQAFSGNTAMKEYHFLPTTPPTLGGSSVFNSIPNDCVIYVPSASLTAYQTAQYWSTYASQMQGE